MHEGLIYQTNCLLEQGLRRQSRKHVESLALAQRERRAERSLANLLRAETERPNPNQFLVRQPAGKTLQ